MRKYICILSILSMLTANAMAATGNTVSISDEIRGQDWQKLKEAELKEINDLIEENKKIAQDEDSTMVLEDLVTGVGEVVFIHRRNQSLRIKAPLTSYYNSKCSKQIGVKWGTLPVSYVINPSNPQNLNSDVIINAISKSAGTWNGATSKELIGKTYTVNYNAQYGADGRNDILFGSLADNRVIAVTSVWYSLFTKKIVEFDFVFNSQYTWGDATMNPSVMDLQNIATHEFGHGIGLGDVFGSSCEQVTMYGYSWNGDTQKRTLETPDIYGVQRLYG